MLRLMRLDTSHAAMISWFDPFHDGDECYSLALCGALVALASEVGV